MTQLDDHVSVVDHFSEKNVKIRLLKTITYRKECDR